MKYIDTSKTTPNELRRLFPNASRSTLEANSVVLPNPEPECDQAPALERPVPRKKRGLDRITVRFTGYRCRPLDPDNFAGSVKELLDGLRHAHLLPNDTIWDIALETGQVRVGVRGKERTEIEIIYPEKGRG